MHGLQVGDGEPEVTLGRGEARVPEQGLHVAQVRVVLEQVRRARVPPQVRRDVLLDPGRARSGAATLAGPSR